VIYRLKKMVDDQQGDLGRELHRVSNL
jgi:hypothetical protein